jgi:hypothetical protein
MQLWQENNIKEIPYLESHNVYVINFLHLSCLSPKFGDDITFLDNYTKQNITQFLNELKYNYSNLVLFCAEEFNYNFGSVKHFIDTALELGFKLFIQSFNSNVNDFLKIKFPNEYGITIFANSAKSLLFNPSPLDINFNVSNVKRDLKLLFLNFNRKINRDWIISYLNKKNELFNNSNFISYLNHHTFPEEKYYNLYNEYALKNNIDFEWLKSLKLIPQEVDVHSQAITQTNAQILHLRSKFNIIAEPFFGLSDDVNNFEYYNHTLSRKTIYPIYYRNVIYVHGYNTLLKNTLQELGFETFFDNLDDFISNMNDEFYYSKETQEKLNKNEKLIYEYFLSYKDTQKDEILGFFNG